MGTQAWVIRLDSCLGGLSVNRRGAIEVIIPILTVLLRHMVIGIFFDANWMTTFKCERGR